ncbi:hypothetical protein MRB53_034075 [Persea americana]|uniref:Uncharacterized protein n=1 Tax=Persea americana TaxID=3435 RepID=A0ACC2KWK4_PERAE|nr:hypothetical protein MRB53_034075 [Persea americana]
MAPPPSVLQVLLLVLVIASLLALPTCSTSRLGHKNHVPEGIRVDLIHVDYGGNFTKLELLQRAIKRGKHRLERLKATAILAADDSGEKVQAPTHAGNGEFLVNLAIGTPPVPFAAILDTGSDLIWTQCKPCTNCYQQTTPIFDPSDSSSYSKLPCSSPLCTALPTSMCSSGCEYLYAYGDYSTTQGVMASETFTFGSTKVPKIGFGCGDDNEGRGFSQGAGLVGLGRGPLSLISQLGSGKFSYCLTSIDDTKTSPLLFGSLANMDEKVKDQAGVTPLVQNPSQPSFFYLSLEDITVGGTLLGIPKSTFALNEDGTGGLIIDSGTTITYLESAGYKLVKKAFASQTKLPVADGSATGLDLCFSVPSDSSTVEVPKLTFHFKGADIDLPPDNYMIQDSSTGLLCLLIMESSGMSIFGNMQQQNLQVVYDLEKEVLSIAPVQCDQL